MLLRLATDLLGANLDRDQLGSASGVLDRLDRVFRRVSAHRQRQLAVGGCLNGGPVNALHVFGSAGAAAVYSHKKLRVSHGFPFQTRDIVRSQSASNRLAARQAVYSFMNTLSAIREADLCMKE